MASGKTKANGVVEKRYTVDVTTLSNNKYIAQKELYQSELKNVKAVIPLFARKSGYTTICNLAFEGATIRVQSDSSIEGVTVGLLFVY